MKFTEEKLERVIIELLEQESFPHVGGGDIRYCLTKSVSFGIA